MEKKRKVLTVNDKMQIIRELEKGKKKCEIVREYELSNSTVHTIWNKRQNIIESFEQNCGKFKRIRKPVRSDVDKALINWFKEQKSKNVRVNGPLLKAKAEHFAKLLGNVNFVCSSGWIDRFKLRHDISFGKTTNEARSVNNDLNNMKVEHDEDSMVFVECAIKKEIDVENEGEGTVQGDNSFKKTTNETNNVTVEQDENSMDESIDKEMDEVVGEDDNESEITVEEEEEEEVPTINEALEAVKVLNRFYKAMEDPHTLSQIGIIKNDLEKRFWTGNKKKFQIISCTYEDPHP